MAKRKKSEINLVIPSLALSALVFILVVFIINLPKQSTQTAVDAATDRYLSRGNDIESLQNDLILLEADGLGDELTILNSLE